jgi:FliI/YscN family ATPase
MLLDYKIPEVQKLLSIGQVTDVVGLRVYGCINGAAIGDLVEIETTKLEYQSNKRNTLIGQVLGFQNQKTIIAPLGKLEGVAPGGKLTLLVHKPSVKICNQTMIGSAIDAFGNKLWIDKTERHEEQNSHSFLEIDNTPPTLQTRTKVSEVLPTGIKTIDIFCTLGRGQRICLFAEPGVGKSSLIRQIAKHSSVDLNIIALIGERAREAAEFIQALKNGEINQNTILVISTSDEPALMRCMAAKTATRIAEHYRDQGCHVLLQLDSLTRYTRALREVGLNAGEIPVRRGYPPSVFAEVPRLVERIGATTTGSITAIYTVLLSSDLDEDPMVDEIKGLVDGHIILSKQLAKRGHYPAIDILNSISRLASSLLECETLSYLAKIRELLFLAHENRGVIHLGVKLDENIKKAIELEDVLYQFLTEENPNPYSLTQCLCEIKTRLKI